MLLLIWHYWESFMYVFYLVLQMVQKVNSVMRAWDCLKRRIELFWATILVGRENHISHVGVPLHHINMALLNFKTDSHEKFTFSHDSNMAHDFMWTKGRNTFEINFKKVFARLLNLSTLGHYPHYLNIFVLTRMWTMLLEEA